jgi:hypothetical protein
VCVEEADFLGGSKTGLLARPVFLLRCRIWLWGACGAEIAPWYLGAPGSMAAASEILRLDIRARNQVRPTNGHFNFVFTDSQ